MGLTSGWLELNDGAKLVEFEDWEEDIKEDLANPFEQFKSFILYNINLLNQKDVIQSILKQLKENGLEKKVYLEYYKWWINKIFREIRTIIQHADKSLTEGWKKLFTALQCLCLFWFSVRNQDIKLIRKGDLYMYLLSQLLLNKQKSPSTKKTFNSKKIV